MRLRGSLILILAILLFPSQGDLRARGKLDVINLRNGDTVTGEIVGLDRGILTVKTDFMGTIKIEWRGVLRITSPQLFEVERGDGVRFTGSFFDTEADGKLAVRTAGDTVSLLRPEVVRIRTRDTTFLDRLSARLDFGFDLTRANRNTTYTLGSEAKYRADRFISSVKFNSFLTTQENLNTQTRNVLALSHEQLMRDRWFGVALGQFQQNEELGLDLRSNAGGGIGRYLLQSNRWMVSGGGGAAYVHERFVDTAPVSNAVSFAFFGVDFFQFEGSERDLSVNLIVWPSLTDFGRVRMDLDATMRFEIFSDLDWGFTFWNNYDSRPPTEDSVKNDYGLSTTIGYSF